MRNHITATPFNSQAQAYSHTLVFGQGKLAEPISIPALGQATASVLLGSDADLLLVAQRVSAHTLAPYATYASYPAIPWETYIRVQMLLDTSGSREQTEPVQSPLIAGHSGGANFIRLPYILPRFCIITMSFKNIHPTQTLNVIGVAYAFKME